MPVIRPQFGSQYAETLNKSTDGGYSGVLPRRRDFQSSAAHSARKDVIGSAPVARRAEGRLASVAVPTANAPTPIRVSGSLALTPYDKLSSTPANARAHPSPIATPITVSNTPCFITIFIKFHELAPRATRIPNSCILWLTEYEITP